MNVFIFFNVFKYCTQVITRKRFEMTFNTVLFTTDTVFNHTVFNSTE